MHDTKGFAGCALDFGQTADSTALIRVHDGFDSGFCGPVLDRDEFAVDGDPLIGLSAEAYFIVLASRWEQIVAKPLQWKNVIRT
eukprot:COSAG06_NODE_355_length_16870_cov_21.389064_3_plen_84_part_00